MAICSNYHLSNFLVISPRKKAVPYTIWVAITPMLAKNANLKLSPDNNIDKKQSNQKELIKAPNIKANTWLNNAPILIITTKIVNNRGRK